MRRKVIHPLVGAAAAFDDASVVADRVCDRRAVFRAQLSGLEPLVCGCQREGPPRPGCPIHDGGQVLRRPFLFSDANPSPDSTP